MRWRGSLHRCHVPCATCVWQVVTKLLEAGARVNLTDRIGRSVLHLAAEHGHADAVAILVSAMAKQQLDLHAEVCPQCLCPPAHRHCCTLSCRAMRGQHVYRSSRASPSSRSLAVI